MKGEKRNLKEYQRRMIRSLCDIRFALVLLAIIGRINMSYCQEERLIVDVTSLYIENYLGKSSYVTDTIKELDGYIYVFKFTDDFGYVRVNGLTNSEFDCCNGLEYSEKSEIDTDANYSRIISSDQGGIKVGSELFWRRVIIGNYEIVYNLIPESRVGIMDKIFTSIKLELSETLPR